jgi:hypothetical protein
MSIASRPATVAACLTLAAGGAGALGNAANAAASPVHRGTGSFTVTGPKGRTRSRSDVKLTCRAVDGRYVVSAGGMHHRVRLVVKDYTGAGAYTATVVISRHSATGSSRHRYAVPVTLTATGGSATYSRTLTGKHHAALKGKTISASASWTCSV